MGRSGLPRVPSRPQTIPFDAPEACTKFRGRAWPGSKWVNSGPVCQDALRDGGVDALLKLVLPILGVNVVGFTIGVSSSLLLPP